MNKKKKKTENAYKNRLRRLFEWMFLMFVKNQKIKYWKLDLTYYVNNVLRRIVVYIFLNKMCSMQVFFALNIFYYDDY